MAFRAVFHGLSDPARKTEIFSALAQYRVEKAIQILKKLGAADGAVEACIERELLHKNVTSAD